jgi:tRNA threonylcarbamoyladenosine biosynthesis protein TsaE
MKPDHPIEAATHGVDETRKLAAALGERAVAGDLVLLCGDLGAGKTAFVQGYADALGVTAPVTSPTFTLANRYQGRLDVHHLDVYRLDQLSEVSDLGLYDLLDDTGVVLIEWGDAIKPVLPGDYLEITFTFGDGDDDRRLVLDPVGPRWAARSNALARMVEPWRSNAC